jgi:hypothetical protein
VAFDVRDALSGFPASMLTGTSGVDLKLDDDGEDNILAPEPGYSDTVKVPMITLDKYLATSSIERVDVIKIDIDGAELQALRGASWLLADDQAPCPFCGSESADPGVWRHQGRRPDRASPVARVSRLHGRQIRGRHQIPLDKRHRVQAGARAALAGPPQAPLPTGARELSRRY